MRRRFREADRALQVAVIRDLQRREAPVFAHGPDKVHSRKDSRNGSAYSRRAAFRTA